MKGNWHVLFSQENAIWYGVDWDGPLCDEDEADQVQVEQINNPLQDNDYSQLTSTILPMSDSNSHGVDLYIRVLEYVHSKLE